MDPLGDFKIDLADPGHADVHPLILAHLEHTRASSPPSSVHSMDIEGLRGPGTRFWTISDSDGALGCAALKQLPDGTAEIKSVHVARAARGRGLARRLMVHLIGIARAEKTAALVLETGSYEVFAPARGLYESLGFSYCDPILGYEADPHSAFMRLGLVSKGSV